MYRSPPDLWREDNRRVPRTFGQEHADAKLRAQDGLDGKPIAEREEISVVDTVRDLCSG